MKGSSLLLTLTVLCFSVIGTGNAMGKGENSQRASAHVVQTAAIVNALGAEEKTATLQQVISARRAGATGTPVKKKNEEDSDWASDEQILCNYLVEQKSLINKQIRELEKRKEESTNFASLSQDAKKITKQLCIQKVDLDKAIAIYRQHSAHDEEVGKLQKEWDITNGHLNKILDSRNVITQSLINFARVALASQEKLIEELTSLKSDVDTEHDKTDQQTTNKLLAVAKSTLDDRKKDLKKALRDRKELLEDIKNSTLDIDKSYITQEIEKIQKEINTFKPKKESNTSIPLPAHIQNLAVAESVIWNDKIYKAKSKLEETQNSNIVRRYLKLDRHKEEAIDACKQANIEYLERAKKRELEGDTQGAEQDRASAAECRKEIKKINGENPEEVSLITKETLRKTVAKHKAAIARIQARKKEVSLDDRSSDTKDKPTKGDDKKPAGKGLLGFGGGWSTLGL